MDLLQVKKTYSLRSFMFLKSLMRILNPWTNVQIWSQYMIHLIWYFFCICSRSTSSERFFLIFVFFGSRHGITPIDGKSPRTWEPEIISQWPETFEMLSGRCEFPSGCYELLSGRCELLSGRCEILSGRCEILSGRALWDAVMFPGFFHLWWHHCPNIDITLPSTMYTVQYKYLI